MAVSLALIGGKAMLDGLVKGVREQRRADG